MEKENKHTNVIAFPNSRNEKFEQQREEITRCVNSITTAMDLPMWDKMYILPSDISTLAEFGETIKFAPQTSARLISVLATQIKRSNTEDLFYE